MHRDRTRVIEGFGDHFEDQGLPRIGGRLLALLLLSPEPLSLDELAETLQVSKGSISSNARMLERSGVAERIKPPGERRDFYRIAEDIHARVMRTQIERMTDMLHHLQQGYAVVPPEQESVRRRFEEMIGRNQQMLSMIREKLGSGEN